MSNDSEHLKWTPALDVGILEMNEEHQQLISRMRKVIDLNGKLTSKEGMVAAFESLIELAAKHFKDEEKVMAEMGFPDLEAHQTMHEDLLSKLRKYSAEFEKSVYGQLPSSVMDFLETWVRSHILIADKKYGEYLLKKSRASSKDLSPVHPALKRK